MKFKLLPVAFAAALALSCSGAPPTEPMPKGPETCDNGKDDNNDGKTDCADPKCFNSAKCRVAVERCDNGIDDDANGLIDCDDMGCTGMDCGFGCTCRGGGMTESACGDALDNDGDLLSDCMDPDCAMIPPCGGAGGGSGAGGSSGTGSGGGSSGNGGGASGSGGGSSGAGGGTAAAGGGTSGAGGGVSGAGGGGVSGAGGGGMAGAGGGSAGAEICNDGIDNDGDRAVDCADSNCSAGASCVMLADGEPCTANTQCAGGRCLTEAMIGYPSGYCTNADAAPCTVGSNAGCHGGTCIAGSPNRCFKTCSGNGLTGPNRCRAGYACTNHDDSASTPNLCRPLCTSDSECAGMGAGYGCNPMTKYCEQKTLPGSGYGAPCNVDTDCASWFCVPHPTFPQGYCAGECRADLNNCGTNGYCSWNAAEGDNVGLCLQACSTNGMVCRTGTPLGGPPDSINYKCQTDTYSSQTARACICRFRNETCTVDSDCCQGSCGFVTAGRCDF